MPLPRNPPPHPDGVQAIVASARVKFGVVFVTLPDGSTEVTSHEELRGYARTYGVKPQTYRAQRAAASARKALSVQARLQMHPTEKPLAHATRALAKAETSLNHAKERIAKTHAEDQQTLLRLEQALEQARDALDKIEAWRAGILDALENP